MKNFKLFLIFLFSLFTIHFSLFTAPASAHCPLCVGGAAIGLSVARFVGIDDAITGVWLGALLGALSFWSEVPLGKKIKSSFLRPGLYLAIFGLTIWSFYAFNDYAIERLRFYLLNQHAGTILGLPKLVFGLVSGGVLFYLIDALDNTLIKKNGKVFFPYQRIVVSLGAMIILSLVFYILINFYI